MSHEQSRTAAQPKNRFHFASVASQRAKQLQQGCVPKVAGSAKIARRAQQEVAQGAVRPANNK
jgi:DNA-directed RNA polymerase subunit K/omega